MIMKKAVDKVYKLLWLTQNDLDKYEAALEFWNRYTRLVPVMSSSASCVMDSDRYD